MKLLAQYLFLFFVLHTSLSAQNNMQDLQLMSYNIRYDNPADGKDNWQYRKQNVADMILKNQTDLLGIQEALYHQVTDLAGFLTDFAWIGVGRDDGQQAGEMMAIFYRKSRLELLQSAHFWLSENSDIAGSKSWETACARMVTWAKFKEIRSGKVFFHFNTHFDHQSHWARRESATLLDKKVKEIAGDTLALITGDFNLTPKDSTYTVLTTHFTDLRNQTTLKNQLSETTFNGFQQKGIAGQLIDFVFTNRPKALKVKDFKILEDKYEGRFPSDHFPIWVKFTFE